jgi:hypothetical protein
MVRCFPEIWPNEIAARRTLEVGFDGRGGGVDHDALRGLSFKHNDQVLLTVEYQLSGPGQKRRKAYFDSGVVTDPRAWLEERLGELAAFEVVA